MNRLKGLWRLAHTFVTSGIDPRFYFDHPWNRNKTCDPLRILFCGSDAFSATALLTVNAEMKLRPDKIASIDVVCKRAKRTGRGLKTISPSYLKEAAAKYDLPVHEIETFTGWSPPLRDNEPINLIIAVSFGLLVPPRLLNLAKYGGINLHPSILPDLRGPAPIYHTLLSDRRLSGVTLQTLHPTKFDHGQILSQTEWPGLWIPPQCNYYNLHSELSLEGQRVLGKGLRDKVFIPPLEEEVGWYSNPKLRPHLPEPQHAPKILPEDRHIDWSSWHADMFFKRRHALGQLWNKAVSKGRRRRGDPETAVEKRVFIDIFPVEPPEGLWPPFHDAGRPFIWLLDGVEVLLVWTKDPMLLSIPAMKVEGEQVGNPVKESIKAGFMDLSGDGVKKLRSFHQPLF